MGFCVTGDRFVLHSRMGFFMLSISNSDSKVGIQQIFDMVTFSMYSESKKNFIELYYEVVHVFCNRLKDFCRLTLPLCC